MSLPTAPHRVLKPSGSKKGQRTTTGARTAIALGVALSLGCAVSGGAVVGGSVTGCSKKTPGPPPPPAVDGLAAFGNSTKVVLGFDIVKLEASRLVRRGVTSMLARDPELAERIRGIASDCQLEPGKNVLNMLVGIGDGPTDLLLVVEGRFEENALTACVQKRLAESGGQLTTLPIAGRTAYKASGAPGEKKSDPVWLALGSAKSLIVAGSREWLEIALGKGPRLTTDPEMKARLDSALTASRAATKDKPAAWAIGVVPPAVGAQLAAATGNTVAAPKMMSAQVDFRTGSGADSQVGIAATLRAEMASAKDANALKSLADLQKPLLSAVAHKKGLGQLVAKLDFSTDGASLVMSFVASETELSDLVAAVDNSALNKPTNTTTLDTPEPPKQNPSSPDVPTDAGALPAKSN